MGRQKLREMMSDGSNFSPQSKRLRVRKELEERGRPHLVIQGRGKRAVWGPRRGPGGHAEYPDEGFEKFASCK